jgi:peptidoglycan/LPS O-acetylase OafA/YrhL/cellulose synthase/poly-beta-1,6-N-acetylglucosamine synthase-like glycosyltransferase
MVYRDIAVASRSNFSFSEAVQAIALAVLTTALAYGSLVYLLARCGYVRRRASVINRSLDELESIYLSRPSLPSVCVLIPSYKEEERVLRQTILSAALSVYGARRIAVLLDDPQTGSAKELDALESSRRLVRRFHAQFHAAATRVRAAYSNFLLRKRRGVALSATAEIERVAGLYDAAAAFVEGLRLIEAPRSADKADIFLSSQIIKVAADRHRQHAKQLREADPDIDQVERELHRLIAQLSVEIASFERKRYGNLSHAPNKAMNLNSYIALLGKSFRVVHDKGLPRLEECQSSHADLIVPDASYLLTIDADSMVLPDYVLKLVDIMESDPEVAVAQTPYSAIPGESTALERAAGVQTDLQYVVHQGSTGCNATFWVGANALLRVRALRAIETTMIEGDKRVPVYIQDRTVIEDTGSTIDLIRRGWRLHNHPERLAYSATPSDFGSLVIQRRRWSNGGLIILPDLLRYCREQREKKSCAELFMRAHYLCGPALSGLSLLLLLLVPFDGGLLSAWLPATVLPYYALYARDARALRYRWRELVHVYTLNLMLLPVILAGVSRSLQQAITGRKSPFGRTPKTEDRTPVQPLHVLLQLGLLVAVAVIAADDASNHQYLFSACRLVNFALMVMGFGAFLGFRAAWHDLALRRTSTRRAQALAATQTAQLAPQGRRRTGQELQPMTERRILPLDGIRAYAISLVFLVHFLSHYYNGATSGTRIDFDAYSGGQTLSTVIAHYFWASHYGVDLFFLLSGFLIVRIISRPDFAYVQFLRNRLLRLYPAFLLALAVHLAYMAAFWNKSFDGTTIAANVVLLHGLWELKIQPIIVPTWSLTYEWMFYLAFPAVVLLTGVRNRVALWHLALCAFLVLACAAPVGPHYMRMLMFLVGGAFALKADDAMRKLAARVPDIVIVLVYAFANVVFVRNQNWYQFIPIYLVTSGALVVKAVYGDGFLNKIFCWPVLRRIGAMSYSFYLFHGLAIVMFCDWIGPYLRQGPDTARLPVLLIGSFALGLLMAGLSYWALERPYFLRKGEAARVPVPTMGSKELALSSGR